MLKCRHNKKLLQSLKKYILKKNFRLARNDRLKIYIQKQTKKILKKVSLRVFTTIYKKKVRQIKKICKYFYFLNHKELTKKFNPQHKLIIRYNIL